MNQADEQRRGNSMLAPETPAAVFPRSDNPRITRAVEEYVVALQAGQGKPDRQAFLDRHGDIAAELAECLEGLEFIQTAAHQLRESAADASGSAAPDAIDPLVA